MFWEEAVRFCKNCKHYQSKGGSVPWNYECKLGEKTSIDGNTPACNRYERQYTLFSIDYYCKDCARWEDSFLGGRCIKDYPAPKGRNSESCKYFVKG